MTRGEMNALKLSMAWGNGDSGGPLLLLNSDLRQCVLATNEDASECILQYASLYPSKMEKRTLW